MFRGVAACRFRGHAVNPSLEALQRRPVAEGPRNLPPTTPLVSRGIYVVMKRIHHEKLRLNYVHSLKFLPGRILF